MHLVTSQTEISHFRVEPLRSHAITLLLPVYTLPKGLLSLPLGYLNKICEKLVRHTENGDVNIDNNFAEKAIHPLFWVVRIG